MNELIRELAKESDLDWHRHWNDDESNRLEKFAELIVKECFYKCVDMYSQQYILEHFDMDNSNWTRPNE